MSQCTFCWKDVFFIDNFLKVIQNIIFLLWILYNKFLFFLIYRDNSFMIYKMHVLISFFFYVPCKFDMFNDILWNFDYNFFNLNANFVNYK
jgi:hypothetical protein